MSDSPLNLTTVWELAEREFPASERFGIEAIRHVSGFYIGQISQVRGPYPDDGGTHHIISHVSATSPQDALSQAIGDARRALAAGIDWMGRPLPKADEPAPMVEVPGMTRRHFEMTQADLDGLMAKINAARNAPLIAIHCGMPQSPQEAANDAWADLGKRMGFRPMSVEPANGGPRHFTAEPAEISS